MSLRIATSAITAMLIFGTKTDAAKISDALSYKVITIQDSLPSLHTIPDSMILKINTSFHTITVGLKNDSSYIYNLEDWDYEDYYPSTAESIKDAIRRIKITFTRTEQMPEYRGGEQAWAKYLNEFCLQHKDEIEKHGDIKLTVRFIVHVNGQVTDIEFENGASQSSLAPLAIACVQNAPDWQPAVQNGRKVPCYKIQEVKLELP
jgi:hypothetical protein